MILGADGEMLRTMERSVILAGHPTRVIFAHRLSENNAMLGSLRTFLLLCGGFGILLIALLGWQISRSTLRPLHWSSGGAERAEGSGLGLVLVKSIIEAHHDKIEDSNPVQRGSCFCITCQSPDG